MRCLHPISVSAPESLYNHFGVEKILVPCGHCEACLENRSKEWFIRLSHEVSHSSSCYFVTLTFDDFHLPLKFLDVDGKKVLTPVVSKSHLQKFFKRLRKRLPDSGIRYYAISEYGPSTFRPHFHCIIFNLPHDKVDELISDAWQQGFVKVDPINDARIRYVTYYVHTKTELPDYLPKPFTLMSRRPAIGHSYYESDEMKYYHTSRLCTFVMKDGYKYALPRLYKLKIFSPEQLTNLQLENYERETKENARRIEARAYWYNRPTRTVFEESPLEAEQRRFQERVEKRTKKRKDI